MPDNKPKKAYSHSEQLSADDHPEVAYFATRHGLSTDQVHQLIDEHGNDRVRLEHAASKLQT